MQHRVSKFALLALLCLASTRVHGAGFPQPLFDPANPGDLRSTHCAIGSGMNDSTARLEMLIHELEQQMPDLQLRHGDVFALANAWAERYDAILAVTPPALRADVEARLSRIGIRWGVMPGARVTREFRALGKRIPRSE